MQQTPAAPRNSCRPPFFSRAMANWWRLSFSLALVLSSLWWGGNWEIGPVVGRCVPSSMRLGIPSLTGAVEGLCAFCAVFFCVTGKEEVIHILEECAWIWDHCRGTATSLMARRTRSSPDKSLLSLAGTAERGRSKVTRWETTKD